MVLCRCGCERPVFKGDDGICNSCVREHRTELLEACKWFMQQLDDGVLVRDISRDGEPDYHKRMLEFVFDLGKAFTAIAKAEGSAP